MKGTEWDVACFFNYPEHFWSIAEFPRDSSCWVTHGRRFWKQSWGECETNADDVFGQLGGQVLSFGHPSKVWSSAFRANVPLTRGGRQDHTNTTILPNGPPSSPNHNYHYPHSRTHEPHLVSGPLPRQQAAAHRRASRKAPKGVSCPFPYIPKWAKWYCLST